MTATVHVRYLINDTVLEETHTADHITYQLFDTGRAIVQLHNDGQLTETITYRRAERIHRTIGGPA